MAGCRGKHTEPAFGMGPTARIRLTRIRRHFAVLFLAPYREVHAASNHSPRGPKPSKC